MTATTTQRPIRVFQVATGNVGTEMIKRIGNHPDLELVGLHCYTPEKVGRDAGEIAGLAPIGVTATGSVDDIIAAKPDVLTFHGVFPDEDLYVKVLEAGIYVVTTADWITGWHKARHTQQCNISYLAKKSVFDYVCLSVGCLYCTVQVQSLTMNITVGHFLTLNNKNAF